MTPQTFTLSDVKHKIGLAIVYARAMKYDNTPLQQVEAEILARLFPQDE